jgi:SAM-dependent methyltransferase
MHSKWKNNAVHFDKLYTGAAPECRIPYFGTYLRTKLNQRLENALTFVKFIHAKKVIDLGCGTGTFAIKAASKGIEVHGYDISEEAIKIARMKAEEAGVSDRCYFYEVDITTTDFPDAEAWLDLGCLQYVSDITTVINKISRVRDFYSGLPMKYHWLNVIRFPYRRALKGNRYYMYTAKEIRHLFHPYKNIHIEKDGLQYYVSSVNFKT